MIVEKSTQDKPFFTVVRSILGIGNRQIVILFLNFKTEKTKFLKKKWYHLKSSNLSEKEYRMKEKALKRSEEEETKELKRDIHNKLTDAKVKGFESKQELIDIIVKDLNANPVSGQTGPPASDITTYELDDRTYLGYQNSQGKLLEKLLSSSFFHLNNNDPALEEDLLNLPSLNKRFSEQDRESKFSSRKPKIINIKLSRYLSQDLHNMVDEHINIAKFIEESKESDFHIIGEEEMNKIANTPSDKTYFNQRLVESKYTENKNFLVNLRKRGKISPETLTDQDLDQLINACSFSLNGVHYLQKFKKSKNMLHPIDLLYVLSKIK